MCLWCEVEERVYRSYEDQERKALQDIRRLLEECPGQSTDSEDCPDRLRCLWEKKLEFVVARLQKERLAVEMADFETCDPEDNGGRRHRPVRQVPSPSLSPHLLHAFERYIETMFDRLTRGAQPAPGARRRGRKLIRFEQGGDPPR